MPSEKQVQKFHTDDTLLPRAGCASDWLSQISYVARPIRNTTQIWVVTRHQCGISVLISQTSFGGETSGSIAKCRLFSQATKGAIKVKRVVQVSCLLLMNFQGFSQHLKLLENTQE